MVAERGLGWCGCGGLGGFDARAGGDGVGANLDGLLVLPGGLGSIFTLNQRLLDDAGRLVGGGGLAAFERAWAGASGHQNRQREPSTEQRAEVFHGGGPPLI